MAVKVASGAATRANQELEEAQQTILQLTSGSVSMLDLEGWASSMAKDLSQLIGARVEVVLEDQQPAAGVHIDPVEETRRLAIGAGTSRFGALGVARRGWTERGRMLRE